MNSERVERRIANVWPVRVVIEQHKNLSRGPVGIKQTEPKLFPLKGYLSVREGDILCVPQNSSGMAKHMADLVS